MAQGIERGMEKGIAQGIEKGIAQAIERGMEKHKGIEQGHKPGAAAKHSQPDGNHRLACGASDDRHENSGSGPAQVPEAPVLPQ